MRNPPRRVFLLSTLHHSLISTIAGMSWLSVKLNLNGRDCVVIGGGQTAARRARSLLAAGAKVTIIAPSVDEHLASMKDLSIVERAYQPGDMHGRFLAVIATDDPCVNDAAAEEATRAGVLVNRADDAGAGDVTFPASAAVGRVTLSVDTDAALPGAARAMRDELAAAIDPDWHATIDIASARRLRILADVADPAERRERIRRLTDADAIALFKSGGEKTYRRFCQSLASGQAVAPLAKGTHD